jgi:hypothetical protein
VEIPRLGLIVEGPRLGLLTGEDDSLPTVSGLVLAPYVPVAVWRGLVAPRGHKPWVFCGGVVDDEVQYQPYPALSSLQSQLGEVTEATETVVDSVIVGDIIAIVAIGRGMDRVEPQTCDAQPREVVEPADQPLQVAVAVAIGVLEGLHVDAIDDRFLVPPF